MRWVVLSGPASALLLLLCLGTGAHAQGIFSDNEARREIINLREQLRVQVDRLTKQIAETEAARRERDAPLERALQEARAQLQALTQTQAQIQTQADERLRRQEGDLAQQKQELNRATSEQAQQLRRVIDNLNKEFDQVRKDFDQVRADNALLARLVSAGNQEIARMKSSQSDARETLQTGLEGIRAQIRKALDVLDKQLLALQDELGRLRSDNPTTDRAAGKAAEELSELRRNQVQLQGTLSKIQGNLGEMRKNLIEAESALGSAQK